ncbi:hypothetical protein HOB10_01345 [Candidatus Parcubacteria bacterium]|jgi:hypothetical protein|nr:hypothetical protein [Candidatus Parcubacteria bacterium]
MKKLLLVLILPLAIAGCGKNGNPPTQEEIDEGIEVVEDMLQETSGDYKVRGSCNTIDDKSHCVDYIGSFWTEQQMELNCGSEGTFSKNTCPYSTNGGCQTGGKTITEVVIWSYDHGGQPISGEEAQYEAMACNVNPLGTWVTPDQIFLDN